MGSCKKCGECCKVVYWFQPEHIELTEVQKLRGFQALDDKTVAIPCACSLLDLETGLCKDYVNRPEECKEYPKEGDLRPKTCRYGEYDSNWNS